MLNNNQHKNAKLIFSLILIVLILVGGGFYWFQIRPVKMRSFCIEWVSKNVKDSQGNQIQGNIAWNKAYRLCLAGNGIKPENLFNEN